MQKSKKTLENKLDAWWRLEDKTPETKCELCEFLGSNFNYHQVHAHHAEGRRKHRLRWDLRNKVWLCPHHHTLGKQSAHKNADWFDAQFKSIRPDDYEYIKKAKEEITHYKESDLQEMLDSH
jgi:hypothetical protein